MTAPKHVRGGNCWAGNTKTDVCLEHDEPRGSCDVCPKCPACSKEADVSLERALVTVRACAPKVKRPRVVWLVVDETNATYGRWYKSKASAMGTVASLPADHRMLFRVVRAEVKP